MKVMGNSFNEHRPSRTMAMTIGQSIQRCVLVACCWYTLIVGPYGHPFAGYICLAIKSGAGAGNQLAQTKGSQPVSQQAIPFQKSICFADKRCRCVWSYVIHMCSCMCAEWEAYPTHFSFENSPLSSTKKNINNFVWPRCVSLCVCCERAVGRHWIGIFCKVG